jgi:hypothetical protein
LVAADELGVVRLTDAGVRVRNIVVPKKRRGTSFIEQAFGSSGFLSQRRHGAQPNVLVIKEDDDGAVHGKSSARFDRMSSDELDKALEKVIRREALEE